MNRTPTSQNRNFRFSPFRRFDIWPLTNETCRNRSDDEIINSEVGTPSPRAPPASRSAPIPRRALSKRRVKYEKLVHTKDRIFLNQKLNTGALEDLRLWFLLRIDSVVNFFRGLLHRFFEPIKSITFFGALYFIVTSTFHALQRAMHPTSIVVGVLSFVFRVVTAIAALFINLPMAISRFFTPFPVDRRTTRDLVVGQGYPYEKYDVVTQDGYILQLERLPQPKSSNVLYFQHGVVDNSFAWFGHIEGEAASALAFRAFDAGYDVFVGTLRGCGGSTGHTTPKLPADKYWDFTVNEHAFQDLPAFVSKIRELKNVDLNVPEGDSPKHKLTFIAHSVRYSNILLNFYFCDLICLISFIILDGSNGHSNVHRLESLAESPTRPHVCDSSLSCWLSQDCSKIS